MSDHASTNKPTAAKIKATLSIGGQDLTEEQAASLTAFVDRLGIDRARQAIDSLEKLKKAA